MAPPPLPPTPHGWLHPLSVLGGVFAVLGAATLPHGWMLLVAGVILGIIGTTCPTDDNHE